MTNILFDIGGTKMRVAKSSNGKTFCDPVIVPTQAADGLAGVSQLIEMIREIASDEEIHAIGGGIAGVFDPSDSFLVRAANLPGWVDVPLKERLLSEFKVPVCIENDTAVVGLGEAYHGAGTARGIMAYVTVSTGVGGVRIVDGVVDSSRYGFEIGHQYIDFDGSHCADCSEPKDFESYISGKSLEKRYGKKAYELTDPALWKEEARLLAVGLANTIMHWSPDIVVLGGSMIVGTPSISVDDVVSELKKYLLIYPELPIIKRAACGDTGGLAGALELLRIKNML